MAKRGAFIVIEGLDRSGKTTQTGRLLERLGQHDRPVQLFKFPGELHI
jgi:dTMP kinase